MSKKCKSASPGVIQVKNSRKIVGTDKKLDIISRLEKVNELLTYIVMLDSLMVAYVQLVIMLLELQKVLSQELKFFFCVAKLPQSCWNELYQKVWMWASYIFISLVNKYIV